MTKNVGKADKVVRWVLGAVLLAAGFKTGGALGIALGVAALVSIGTALMGWCGLYTLLGINTCPLETPPPAETKKDI